VVLEFARHGFYRWGGDWDYPIDYQHFELGSRPFVEALVALEPAQARRELATVAARFDSCVGADAEPLGSRRQRCVGEAIERMDERAAVLPVSQEPGGPGASPGAR
jgi:hypothetical protein